MVLSDREIWMEVGTGRREFTPALEFDQVSPSSVDLRLSNGFTVFPRLPGVDIEINTPAVENVEAVIARYGERQILLAGEYLLLRPGDFALSYTLEYIRLPNYLAARVEGRSTLARLGLSIRQTARRFMPLLRVSCGWKYPTTGLFPAGFIRGRKSVNWRWNAWAALPQAGSTVSFSSSGKGKARPAGQGVFTLRPGLFAGRGPLSSILENRNPSPMSFRA